jgi:hypothetical protein
MTEPIRVSARLDNTTLFSADVWFMVQKYEYQVAVHRSQFAEITANYATCVNCDLKNYLIG